MSTQIKLLRVLEDHQITRVGDNKPIKVNVRLVSATNRNLEEAMEAGDFRRDLYYRLKVVTVQSAAACGIAAKTSCRWWITSAGSSPSVTAIRSRTISPTVSRKLFSYDWPGNVRQLRNAVETMVVLDTDGVLDVDDLPPELVDVPSPRRARSHGPTT